MCIKIYEVGGKIRDELLGIPSKDIDYSVEAPSFDAMEQYIKSKGGDIKVRKPKYFVIKALMPDIGPADFVLCRKDKFYTDGRRPDDVEVGTIHDDLARRDFTMNAIAKDVETGEYLDPFHGRHAIEMKNIVCVGSTDRIKEDSLRMLRAIRFSITKGFTINRRIRHILKHDFHLLKNISIDRIREELTMCFKYDTYRTLCALDEYRKLREYIFTQHPMILVPSTPGKRKS